MSVPVRRTEPANADAADAEETESPRRLFRQATSRPTRALFAEVSVLTPPSLWAAGLTAVSASALLMAAACLVRIPDRVSATGLLMPSGGVVRLAAPAAGRIAALHAAERDIVFAGRPIADLDKDLSAGAQPSLSVAKRRSVDAEARLLEDIEARQLAKTRERRAALESELRFLASSRQQAAQSLALLTEFAGLAQRRLERFEALGDRVAADRIDRLQGERLDAERAQLDAQSRVADIDRVIGEARFELAGLDPEAEIRRLEIRVRRQALERQRADADVSGSLRLHAPIDARVLRIAFEVGDSVAAGATVVSLMSVDDRLEARLYVPARDAARMARGQTVELLIDALPYQRYGSIPALISTVGDVALHPSEVPALMTLREAVFEVRARLPENFAAEFVPALLPGIGASFRADIVRRQLTLLEWLLRATRGIDA